jgi:hypothetical protein
MGKMTSRTIRKQLEQNAQERAMLEAEKREASLHGFKPATVGDMLRTIGGPHGSSALRPSDG